MDKPSYNQQVIKYVPMHLISQGYLSSQSAWMCWESSLDLVFFDFLDFFSASSPPSTALFWLSVLLSFSVIDWEWDVAAADTDCATSEFSFEFWDYKSVIRSCRFTIFGSSLVRCAGRNKTRDQRPESGTKFCQPNMGTKHACIKVKFMSNVDYRLFL